MQRTRETVTIRNAIVKWPNFTGEKREYNPEGIRNFVIELDEPLAMDLLSHGWNVRQKVSNDDPEDITYQLKVAVSYKVSAPQVWLIASGMRVMLGEDVVGQLDKLEYSKIDLVLSPYDWNVNGNTGRKAYLQSLYYTMYEDELALEYANIPVSSFVGAEVRELESAEPSTDFDYEGEVVG